MPMSHGVSRRSFHSTSRRDAIPLLPAGIAILKSTSLLTAITAISRVLISFFPIGTLAAFKMNKATKWLASEEQKPQASPVAEEFWQMWCKGEKHAKIPCEDGPFLLEGKLREDGALVAPGKNGEELVAHRIPIAPRQPTPGSRKEWFWMEPTKLKQEPRFKNNDRAVADFLRRSRFYLPPLPEASLPYYRGLSPAQQTQVDKLRNYWVCLTEFRDRLRIARWIMVTVVFLPCLLLLGVYVAALERVPLTGRWRLILLTPEEEDKISTSLAGPNWYKSVINLLTTPEAPAPPVVPLNDWRWHWVEETLRRLERGAVRELMPARNDDASASGLRPPPAQYPLKPRPRVSSRLHSALPGGEPSSGMEHLEIGPPYSLMLMEKDEKNAFSYGFGGKGAGGVVVFTGLLDDILREGAEQAPPPPEPQPSFFSRLFSPQPPPTRQVIEPTEQQNLHLACVLAHEMGHLLLSHHLETLSQQQVLWPSILGLSMDLVRAFIWPFTIFLGPTVNDALANVGRTSTEELADRYGEVGFQWKHEILALAGYDPRAALDHFSGSVTDLHEIQPMDKDKGSGLTGRMFKLWTRATHPSPEKRTAAIKDELERWAAQAAE
ncbi:hypothetical protein EHS25_003105 [Saitozyma podzolica]|uniref:Peptidase M48 domain-containing protein n=1 Tax=Saitozyma podzolica TaxID=1890683 RepID=A0A427Y7Y5_9TREE|nr:hypothetical protein EHS25_003105 [Saitozyma podzolica]